MEQKVVDVVLVGGGIMSATLASLLQRVQPDWSIEIYERLDHLAAEATEGWHNSGTGHAALCELNYTPQAADGSIDISKALAIHQQFLTTCEYWASLVAEGALGEPGSFTNSTPHMSFVQGAEDVEFLEARYRAMSQHHFFGGMEFSTDPRIIGQWAPLLVEGRIASVGGRIASVEGRLPAAEPGRNPGPDGSEPMAATYAAEGTDVDFGAVTRQLFDDVAKRGGNIHLNTEVTDLTRQNDGLWRVRTRSLEPNVAGVAARADEYGTDEYGADEYGTAEYGQAKVTLARTVLVGAGGWTLKLLRSAGVPEVKGYGLLPISGKFLSTKAPQVVGQHQVKVYGKAAIGAPPMSVPHLDARVIDGERSVLFGPFAGANPKFLKNGSNLDLVQSLNLTNLWPLVSMGVQNLNLLGFLLKDLAASKSDKMWQLREFAPSSNGEDWSEITAGQRAQIVKPDATGKGVLQFGTEVVTSADGTVAGVLGASPGASIAVPIALGVLKQCFPDKYEGWEQGPLQAYIPSLTQDLAHDAAATSSVKNRIRGRLKLA